MSNTLSRPSGGDVVSQSEIEQLLAQMGAAGDATGGDAPGKKVGGDRLTHRHEFPQLSAFSAGDLRKLRVRHEDFVAALSARLSIHLGLEVKLQMTKLETVPFQGFADSLANPTHLSLLKIGTLPGHCCLDIPLRLALSLVDRELGGGGTWNQEPRELTKVETRLIARVVESILGEWCSVWRDLLELRPVLTGNESNSRFLKCSAAEDMVLVLAIEAHVGPAIDQITVAFPCAALGQILAKLNSAETPNRASAAVRIDSVPKWNPVLNDMPVHLTAALPAVDLPAGKIANLKPGDFIPFPSGALNQISISLEGMPRFVGTLGTNENKWAVKIRCAVK